MKKYNITPDNIRDYMNNYESDFPLVIDDKAGLDYKDEKTRAIPHNSCIYQKKSKTRCVRLEITSFRGISLEAIHYYGKLVADGIGFQRLDNPRITTSNWNAKKINPFYQWRYEFDLRRPVTQEEINHDPDRWGDYQLGAFTASFDTKEEIIALAKECFKMRFTGEWELWVDDCTVAKEDIYQITFEDEQNFKVGDTVRNKRSGNIGQVMEDPRTVGTSFIRVMVLKPDKNIKYCVYWTLKNLELITT